MKTRPNWKLTLLGCGTSTGVPLLFCACKVCRSKNKKNHRLRSSAWLEASGMSILIDTSTDLRQQALRNSIQRVDAILYTHPHADHVSGIDEIRAFNFIQKNRIPAYGNAWTYRDLKRRYPYIFNPLTRVEGGGIPQIDLHLFHPSQGKLKVGNLEFVTLPLKHGSGETVGYRYKNLAYLTDFDSIQKKYLSRLEGLDTLILDCLRIAPHPTHLNLERAIELTRSLRPRRTILTHLGHDFDYSRSKKLLPKGIELAYDGLQVVGEFE